jgi:hypothetical protein
LIINDYKYRYKQSLNDVGLERVKILKEIPNFKCIDGIEAA